jgi:hypothetical protein
MALIHLVIVQTELLGSLRALVVVPTIRKQDAADIQE